MAYKLLLGEYAYSDQSMRGWLEVDAFGIDFQPSYVPMFSEEFAETLVRHAPATSLPILLKDVQSDRALTWESAAAAEILAERHPDAGLWPLAPEARAMARSLSARARTGFSSLQSLPMNLHARYQGFVPSKFEQEDASRVVALLEWALGLTGGPYLCGQAFCAADAAFAPIVTRFVAYGFELTEATKAYVETIYAHPSFRRWHACADAQLRRIDDLHLDLPSGSSKDWPRQPVMRGKPYEGDVSDAINEACPYSGKPVVETSLAEIDGMVVGFCNPFCCRRGMADAESWPTVMAVMGRPVPAWAAQA
ncbi:hypothetical protein ABVF61_15945 [Roseibium sp. HPY-6]|uniref:hypothetical protein n=1 Tax=Roseibium sp. HPY-6 TaxID=3229852 RepID=UPI00338E7616